MKSINYFVSGVAVCFLLVFLTSCEHSVSVESVVHEDGSIDRTVTLSEADSSNENIFGISQQSGWEVIESESDNKKSTVFRKHFNSVDEVNAELSRPVDTLFQIHSVFERKFRWFYTYIDYSDTYFAINRFEKPDVSDYFTSEDYAFIERLPAEGKPISHADSIYLTRLNEKIFDIFGARGLFDVYYDAMIEAIEKSNVEKRWIDTLNSHRERSYRFLMEHESEFEDDFMIGFVDSLNIPVSLEVKDSYEKIIEPIKRRVDFMSFASGGEYLHHITMPWDIVLSNADSVNGRELFWWPPVARFLLKDYTMYAESRQMNYWAVIVSVVIIGFTVFLLFRRKTG